MLYLQRQTQKLFLNEQDRILRNAIYRARNQKWIKKDFQLTEEGKKRIFSFFPPLIPSRFWDGNWYLVIFDIPEKIRKKRDILRDNLKKLGFGKLQESCWISAINYLNNIEKIVKDFQLDSYVILAQTDKLGVESSKNLAEKVWKLQQINQDYLNFIKKWQQSSEEEKFWLLFQYFSILKKDPQLPLDLLPENWGGERAKKLMKDFLKNRKINFPF